MTEGVNYVTLTQYIEVGEKTLLVLPTHILPCNLTEVSPSDKSSTSAGVVHQAYSNLAEQKRDQYAWFDDHCNQEVMVCVHDVITSKAIENLLCHSTLSKPGSAANKPVYEFRRSNKLRMVLTFKPVEHKQHVLFPNQTSIEQVLVRRAAFISEYGRRVLPYLGACTYEGAGYTSYNVLPAALHVYVDNFDLTNRCGIFKMLCLLDPKRKISTDIPSYFKQMAEDKSPEVLPRSSLAGMKRTFYDKSAKASSRITRSKVKRETKSRAQQQPTILQAFANYQQTIKQKGADEFNLPDDILESVWDFDSSQPTCEVEEIHHEGNHTKSRSDIKEQVTTTSLDQTGPDTSTKGKGKKRQRLAADHFSQSITDNTKKTKTRHVSPAKEQRSQQNQYDFVQNESDPFDELLADQAKTRNRPVTEMCVNKKQQKRYEDNEDRDGPYLRANLKPGSSLADVEEDVFSVTSAHSGISTTIDIDLEDMCFDVSTPDIMLSPAESYEPEKALASHLEQSEDVPDPVFMQISMSQPASHSLNTKQEKATLLKRNKSFSDSMLETAKFGDITNTILSPDEDGEASTRKASDELSPEMSIVNLAQDSTSERVEKKRKKKCLPKSGTEIFKGAKNVADLNRHQLKDWMRLNTPVLMDIFKRNQYSWRHEQFNTNPKMRAAMKWRYDSRRFTGDQVKLITDILLKIFCWRHMKYFNYVMSVLLPECLVRVIADVHRVTFEEAEELMFNFQGQARVDLTA